MDGFSGGEPSVQAHLIRAAKYAGNKTKNWSLFCFFRIMKEAEWKATASRVQQIVAAPLHDLPLAVLNELTFDLESVALGRSVGGDDFRDAAETLDRNGFLASGDVSILAGGKPLKPEDFKPEPSAAAFFNWLRVLSGAEKEWLTESTKAFLYDDRAPAAPFETASVQDLFASAQSFVNERKSRQEIQELAQSALAFMQHPEKYASLLRAFGTNAKDAGGKAIEGGLAGVIFYELLRQGAPAFAESTPEFPNDLDCEPGVVRSEYGKHVSSPDALYDRAPINIAFTHAGLSALLLDKTTLASFPDDFKQGMAARAQRLGDVGENAPEYWEGELGLKTVHGFFSGGFAVGAYEGSQENYWRTLRAEIRAFNDPVSDKGRKLRCALGALTRLLGMEIVHVELGQDPYELDNGKIRQKPHRVEHFGFRDGISQPFADVGLADQPSGSGTPARNRTWAPVAPGEIYLDRDDEDGRKHLLPVNPELREDGTYLVFRKLEQDVVGFHSFVGKQKPKDAQAQEALAAQFVGRWKNGTPLVLSPDTERAYELPKGADEDDPRKRELDEALNDFLYAADDPRGHKCPLSAHIRRTNPRDTGGRNDVRRHRILRRGMSYGGALLDPKSAGDGEKRGMLFIAANARIDMQFETIQGEWINGGEFMGQAGLGRCPLTGSHSGRAGDTFLEAGAGAPINGLPAFVRTRGGDYFFAPGVDALRKIARGQTFTPPDNKTPFGGHCMNDPVTPGLFDQSRVLKYALLILFRQYSAVRVELPGPTAPKPGARATDPDDKKDRMVFLARYEDVRRVLMGRGDKDFSVAHYRAAMSNMTRGGNFLVGTDQEGASARDRDRMSPILDEAWRTLAKHVNLGQFVRDTAHNTVETAIRRCTSARRVDLVHDFGAQATYAILDKVFGTPGPDWITELAIALPFARSNVGGLHDDWLKAISGEKPDNPGFTTMQIWSVLLLADLIGNIYDMQQLKDFSKKATLELLAHIDELIRKARANPPPTPRTLLDAFVANEAAFVSKPTPGKKGVKKEQYYRDVALLLAELAGTALTVVPLTLASVMTTVFAMRFDVPRLIDILTDRPKFLEPGETDERDGLRRLIYEAERLNPNMPIRMRRCEVTTTLPSGAIVEKDDWVACIVQAATFDNFEDPLGFSLFPYLPGKPETPGSPVKPRNLNEYFLFGVPDSGRGCWGRDKIAITVLEECLKGAGRLQGLRRVAGPRGEVRRIFNVAVGLQARFVSVRPRKAP
jgi:Dyp-type peroxidase family